MGKSLILDRLIKTLYTRNKLTEYHDGIQHPYPYNNTFNGWTANAQYFACLLLTYIAQQHTTYPERGLCCDRSKKTTKKKEQKNPNQLIEKTFTMRKSI